MAEAVPEDEADDPVREAGEAAARLRERYDELRRIESRIDGYGRDRVEAAADAYRRANRILDRYEEDAVGSGDFESYVRFRGEFGDAVDVDDDLPAAEAFEAADEAVDKRRLSDEDFATAREALEPAGEFVDLLEAYDDAVDDYRAGRKAAKEARKRLESRLEELREVADMADAFGLSMAHHEEPHVAMHLLSSIPNGRAVECFHPDFDPIWHEMVLERPDVSEGTLKLPDDPGIGLDIDRSFVDEHAIDL